MNISKTYFGFTNNLKPMQKVKVENSLNGLIRYNGKVMTEKEYAYIKLQEGYKPTIEENYSYYSRKLQDYTKPKNEYRLELENGYNTITKTLYDYAIYLLENDLIDEEKANKFITEELLRIEEEKQKQFLQDQKEKAEAERIKKEKEEYDEWLYNKAIEYNNKEKYELARDIFLNEIGQYGELQLKKLLVLIENIENNKCRDNLKSWLHSHNTASKKVFFHITGIKLPSTDKGTTEILNTITTKDFTGMLTYKKREFRQDKEVITETFYILIRQPEPHFEEVIAEPLKKYGFDMFITEHNGRCSISEAKTGALITSGNTKTEVLQKLKDIIERETVEKMNSIIQDIINKTGLSPKYAV